MPSKKKTSSSAPGSAIIRHRFNRSKGYEHSDVSRLYTLDDDDRGNPRLESVIERSDLAEMMHAAEMADRDFTAERGAAQIILTSESAVGSSFLSTAEKMSLQAEEELYRSKLKIPRRPDWNEQTTPEELDDNERKSFLEWRRELASLEDNERLVLTPFEKNLDIWRQLWRVLERSDVIVMVVDSRNPLFYRCLDLESYVKELDSCKRTILLLNKADLLPLSARQKWADYFSENNIGYYFWSAKAAEEAALEPHEQQPVDSEESPEPLRILGRDELLDKLNAEATAVIAERAKAQQQDGEHGKPRAARKGGITVGFVGYPNVGKSSTINSLVGLKKTGVTSTPGKTKHFQTLILREDFVLCDCPGLVFPSFSASRSDMAAAGVMPIDRLTDHRGPIEVVAKRISRSAFEQAYGFVLPRPKAHEDPNRPPSAAEVLRALAKSRGHVVSSGLPDEARASRQILKDYLSGKLLDFHLPPGCQEAGERGAEESAGEGGSESEEEEEGQRAASALVEEFDTLSMAEGSERRPRRTPMRAPHKLQQKASRRKDRTWRVGHGGKDDSEGMPVVRGVQQELSHGAARLAAVRPEDRHKIGLA